LSVAVAYDDIITLETDRPNPHVGYDDIHLRQSRTLTLTGTGTVEIQKTDKTNMSGRTVNYISYTGSTPSTDICVMQGEGQRPVIIYVSQCAICSA